MPRLHTVHIGRITHHGKMVAHAAKPSRHALLFELNNWFFDYFYANGLPIQTLPPLDDWTHSAEHNDVWTVQFPSPEWSVSVETEPMIFT